MISKFYELAKFKNKVNYYLFYGENDGQKLDTIESNFKNFTKENTYKYSEKDILADTRIFLENLYSKSFFEKEKLIIIYLIFISNNFIKFRDHFQLYLRKYLYLVRFVKSYFSLNLTYIDSIRIYYSSNCKLFPL